MKFSPIVGAQTWRGRASRACCCAGWARRCPWPRRREEEAAQSFGSFGRKAFQFYYRRSLRCPLRSVPWKASEMSLSDILLCPSLFLSARPKWNFLRIWSWTSIRNMQGKPKLISFAARCNTSLSEYAFARFEYFSYLALVRFWLFLGPLPPFRSYLYKIKFQKIY